MTFRRLLLINIHCVAFSVYGIIGTNTTETFAKRMYSIFIIFANLCLIYTLIYM